MTFADFHQSVFELADMWTDGCEESDYTAFLVQLLDAVCTPARGGAPPALKPISAISFSDFIGPW